MDTDMEQQDRMAELQRVGQAAMTRQERITRQRALDHLDLPAFSSICEVGPFAAQTDSVI